MKVVLSVEAIRYPLTGTGRYAFELARHLPQIEEIEELRFFAGGGFVDLPAPAETPNAVTGRLRRALQKSDTIVALRQAVLNARARSSLSDLPDHVFHGPNFYLPPRRGPNVVTIHDLSIFTMPDCHPPERVRYMRREIKLSLERASIIVTDSDFARAEIADYFSWPQDRIRTVALANSPDFRPRTQSELAPVLARHGISAGQYCLFAGTIEPRKNIGRLIGAYGALPQALRERFPLVLVGHAGWRSEDVHRLIEDGERRGFIRYPLRRRAALRAAVALRRLRPAGAGSHGLRGPGRDLQRRLASGSRRERGAHDRPAGYGRPRRRLATRSGGRRMARDGGIRRPRPRRWLQLAALRAGNGGRLSPRQRTRPGGILQNLMTKRWVYCRDPCQISALFV
jgi:glycosyltransferase involved in cell wall biosynthesis